MSRPNIVIILADGTQNIVEDGAVYTFADPAEEPRGGESPYGEGEPSELSDFNPFG